MLYKKIIQSGLVACCVNMAVFAAPGQAEEFTECLARLQVEAKQRGFADTIIADLGRVKPIERTLELDRSQPEFVQTFAGYFNKRVTDYRIQQGREFMIEHQGLLTDLTRRYGVPGQYLVSFWGMESNFGRHVGKMPVLDTLVTLACDERRSEFFTGELFSALQVMGTHQVTAANMEGSWAGAIGQTQFMPSAYVKFGVDGDGDGRVDLWGSTADALTSAANYLQQLGWQAELRWGREVSLTTDFPYHLAGMDSPRPVSEWRKLGVTKADGSPLPDATVTALLLVPAGADGPKFLVYQNFDVIMKWNRSVFYALSVGHLADRINGAGGLHHPPPDSTPITKAQITQLQTQLKAKGFDPGDIDGQLGSLTSQAIRDFQKSQNLVADGFADEDVLQALGVENEALSE